MSEKEQNSNHLMEYIRGVPLLISKMFTRKNIEDAINFMPNDGDVIIASYPKTGTTWMQYIVLQIISKGQLFPCYDDVDLKIIPHIALTGIAAVNAQVRPRYYKHHIAYDRVKKNGKSKCIYIYRNPEDTVVSYYHFIKNIYPDYPLDLNEFFEKFLRGYMGYLTYFQHVLSFYKHREDKNLLMVSYEKLHANKSEEILRIANFLGDEYCECLLKDDKIIDEIMEHTSFDYMKKNLFMSHYDTIIGTKLKSSEGEPPKVDLFRKGIVGDGKTVLTETQRRRLKSAAEEVLKDTSIIDEWYSK